MKSWYWATAVLLCLVVSGASACSGSDPSDGSQPLKPGAVTTKTPGSATTARLPQLRRLSVDELQLTVATVAGNDENGQPIRWWVDKGQGPVDGYSNQGFGVMLGRPDYVTVTSEASTPDTLYVKFARDMSREVCQAIFVADEKRSDNFTLWPHAAVTSAASAAEVEKNLSYLILRFLGLRPAAQSPLFEQYRTVYLSSRGPDTDSASQKRGWRAVCIALMQDPAFYLH